MAKNRKKKKSVASDKTAMADSQTKSVVNIEEVNLRTVGPVTRVRGVIAVVTERIAAAEEKLTKWGEESPLALKISQALTSVAGEVQAISEALEELETSGFSPSRKSFTALTSVGDHVSLLEKYRAQYDDLLSRELMNDLKVFRKNENRGGLVLEASGGVRIKAAAAHVVRLSQPKAA